MQADQFDKLYYLSIPFVMCAECPEGDTSMSSGWKNNPLQSLYILRKWGPQKSFQNQQYTLQRVYTLAAVCILISNLHLFAVLPVCE